MNENKIIPVSKNVYWIGVLDPDLKTFDVIMETKYGTTYNSYFINSNKKAIVDSAKIKFWDTYYDKLLEICNPIEIEYIIVNHTEPDHSGSIKKLLEIIPNAKVVGSGNAIKYLTDIIGNEFKHIVVKDGDIIDLGNMKLKIIAAPNLHWPDSIYTYLEEEKILFTCDSFGSHFCHNQMYDNLVGDFDDAFKYYYDVILKPFNKFMLKAIEKIKPLEIKAICTGHGPILKSNWKKYVELSEKYSLEAASTLKNNRIFVAYVSAYGYTSQIAEQIVNGINSVGNFEIIMCDIEKMNNDTLSNYITSSNALLIGSPTINQNTLPQIYNLFSLINPIRDKNKLAAAFGSYGWSGEATKIILSVLKNLKLDIIEQPLIVKFKPQEKNFDEYINFGKAFGQKLLEKISNI